MENSLLRSLKEKYLSVFLLGLVAALSVTALLYANQSTRPFIRINPAFATWVSGYTSGSVSRQATVKIQFTHVPEKTVDPEDLEDLFDFDPNIKGTVSWRDSITLEFKPTEWLKSGTMFKGTFELGKLFNTPDSLSVFPLQFQVIKQSFEIDPPVLEAVDPMAMSYQRLTATVRTADIDAVEQIEKIVAVTVNGQSAKIKWEHSVDQRTHNLVVDSIQRLEKEGVVEVAWDGRPIGVKLDGKVSYKVAALGDFRVATISGIDQEESQYVSIVFTDPLMVNQNLEGLVTIGDIGAKDLRCTIERNEIRAYIPSRIVGQHLVRVNAGILNVMGYKMPVGYTEELQFQDLKPAVKIMGKGVIIPNSEKMMLPFEATSLKAVDVTIVKIYENNVGQFLQVNHLNETDQLKRVGRQIKKVTVKLDGDKLTDLRKTNRFALELSKIITPEPGAIYNINFTFKKDYSLYRCPDDTVSTSDLPELQELPNDDWDDDQSDEYSSYWEYDDYYDGDYDWNERDNPCSKSFYNNERWQERNVLASDLALIAKKGADNQYFCAVTNLQTTLPMEKVKLELYDYQNQLLAWAPSDVNGWATIKVERKPYLLIAKFGKQRGYLRLDDGSSLSLSRFDVSGEEVQKGLKGFIYGERGVWRPGDDIFLTFMLDDEFKKLPENHPVALELYNPQGQLTRRLINTKSLNGFYTFQTSTDTQSPTGNWTAKVKVGGAIFEKNIKIETVMPNRLKINLDFGKPYLVKGDEVKAQIEAHWLHGAIAKNLKTSVDVSIARTHTSFKKFDDYTFDDPSRKFSSESKPLFNGELNENGTAQLTGMIEAEGRAAGVLTASFLTKVFEPGGNFSIDQFNIPYYPYENLLGVKTPPGDRQMGILVTDEVHNISVVNLKPDGSYVSGSKEVEVTLYKIDWKWWWDRTEDDLGNYADGQVNQAVQTEKITLKDGKGSWKLKVNSNQWGRYLLRIYDPSTKHATGRIIYMDWSDWSRRVASNPEEATMLTFTADKETYKVGDEVKLTIPGSKNGRALVSVEGGSKVVQTFWVPTQQGPTNFTFKVTPAMLPNVYVHITLIQPHSQTFNDLPIRLYGMIPLVIEDPTTVLKPVINCPAVIRPEEPVTIKVSEAHGKAMTYTLAVVDEGLLDLTRFKTPDPHGHFFAREALGVKTWDLYDYVLGAYAVKLDRILSIGGDEGINRNAGAAKANRFKPVVKFIGPFVLPAGKSASHTITLPQYVGSVRVMVVAGQNGAYGQAEKPVAVRKPLMVLGTMPRMLGPTEEVNFPVTVFAMESQIKNVTVEIQSNDLLSVNGASTKAITFKGTGEQLVEFGLKVKNKLGIAKLKVIARSGNERAEYDVELDVRNPNPYVSNVIEATVAPGQTWSKSYTSMGMTGTNRNLLEVSTIPPINLGGRLKYLIQYPHGCVEQTTSAAFPQLFLTSIMDVPSIKRVEIESNIKQAITRLKFFQNSTGGLGYWQGATESNQWGTSYAGHFMIEAQNQGYSLPLNFLSEWKRYQKREANNWSNNYYCADLDQAYRLYTLALAKAPELGAMNRLKEFRDLTQEARWRLAAAYALTGQKEVALELLKGKSSKKITYQSAGYTFGSALRDQAMMLETMVILGQTAESTIAVKAVSAELNKDRWMSTQETSYCLLAVAKYCGKAPLEKTVNYAWSENGTTMTDVAAKSYIAQQNLKDGVSALSVKIKNNGNRPQFVRLVLNGQPVTGSTSDEKSNMEMDVRYTDLKGSPVDVRHLAQGTDFVAEVTIIHPGGSQPAFENMALSQIFPSGWEIVNTRLGEVSNFVVSSVPTYQDIRDDRVLTYFDLGVKQKCTYRILLNASYCGKFFLPSTYCEAMYNHGIRARKGGMWVEVLPEVRKPGATN